MDMNQVLRRDLTRVFRGADPLNYIEDVRIQANLRETYAVVTLKVPECVSDHPTWCAQPVGNLGDALNELLAQSRAREVLRTPTTVRVDISQAFHLLKPTKIIYSGPKTIVFWPDGTKTMVSLMEGQEHDDYTAYCAAVVKKLFGATHKAKKCLETVAVRPEPKEKKNEDKYEQMELRPIPPRKIPPTTDKAPETLQEREHNG